MLNKVVLVGRLTADIEVKTLSNGSVIGNFTIAVPRKYKDENGDSIVDFFRCVTWKGNAESMQKFTHKGSKVGICGQIQNRCWEDNGVKKYYTEINVEEVSFLDNKETPQGMKETGEDCPF